MLIARDKPPLRGLIFFVVVLGLFLHNGKLPFMIRVGYLSQEILLLLILDLLVLGWIFFERTESFRLTTVHVLLFLLLVFVAVTNPGDWFCLGVMLLYFGMLISLEKLLSCRVLVGLLAASALLAASLSLLEYQVLKYGLFKNFQWLKWLSGYKVELAYFGVYGQVNLLACLLLIGIFTWQQLLVFDKKIEWRYQVPVVILSGVLFLTRSRSGLLALVFAYLLLIYLLWKKGLLRRQTKLVSGLLVALALGYGLAATLGATSIDKSVQLSQGATGDRTSFSRVNFWASAVLIGLDHPWSGAGVGGYKQLLGDYQRTVADSLQIGYDTISQTEWAHNDFLHLFAEHGLLFAALLVVTVILFLRAVWTTMDESNLFIAPAVAGFVVFMSFGHPLRYHATTFCLLICIILLLRNVRRPLVLGRAPLVGFLVVSLVLVNVVFSGHILASYRLEHYRTWAIGNDVSLDDYKSHERRYLADSLAGSAYAWSFKHGMYADLTARIFPARDEAFAAYLLPQVLGYREQNRFASVAYLAAKLAYVKRDYSLAKELADEAFRKKPDLDIYFNMVHMSHVMLISRENNRPVIDLTGEKLFEEMRDAGMIEPSQLDSSGIAI